jgi:hypothetical protein
MRIRLSDPASLDDLADYLRECGCMADPLGADELEVFQLRSPNEHAERMEVGVYVTAWRSQHPGVTAEIVE